jgi:AAA+ ATPase superfamily predicted ATPase
MEKVINPFIVLGTIPEPYFCDREKETERLVRYLTNGQNVVLHASRRIGKSKLIEHCFEQPAIKGKYYTIFVDILQTGNLQEFTYEFGKAVFEATASLGDKLMKQFAQTVRSLHTEYTIDPLTGSPKLSLSIGHIENAIYTIEEVFRFLEQADKPCIVAIDEFQRIADYPEKNVEAILRTHIQRMRNCEFIFAGSDRHLLGQMFLDYNRPFYNSAATITLDRIERSKYNAFATMHFEEFDKHIAPEDVNRVYDLFDGNTFAMQKTLNIAFSLTEKDEWCTVEMIRQAIDEIIEEYDFTYRTHLMSVGPSQKEVLYAIARSGKAMQITGAAFVGKYRLGSASSVQSAVRKLKADGWVAEYINQDGQKYYQVNDYFLMLWIQKRYGQGYEI